MGYLGTKGQHFNVIVKNKTDQPAILNWGGLIVANRDDGVPYVTQRPIPPGGDDYYNFTLAQGGTFWMHSHYKSQEQQLLAAPLIVHDPDDERFNEQVVMFLQDYSFRDPREAYINLRQQLLQKQAAAEYQIPAKPNINMPVDPNTGQSTAAPAEVDMDAYLTNHHTLSEPETVTVWPGDKVRLRIINASANSNFFIDLGSLTGKLFAVDGQKILPLYGSRFQVAMGQRLDIAVGIPDGQSAYPILAQAEGTSKLTGLMLVTANTEVPRINNQASQIAGALDNSQEMNIRPLEPLTPKHVDRSYTLNFSGNSLSYIWTINGEDWPNVKPLMVKPGERIELVFNNKTPFSLPIHLHGHVFQVTEINGASINGAVRDTVLVPANSVTKVVFDANNPGVWLLSAQVPYYLKGSMMTLIDYEGHPVAVFEKKDTGIVPAL